MKEKKTDSIFAQRVTEAIDKSGMRKIDVARKVGISKGMITQYTLGYCEARREIVIKLGTALGVSPAWLAGYDS